MSEFASQNTEQLRRMLEEKREALRVFRFEGAGSRTRNVREGRNLRRDIARILTELRARELEVAKGKNKE